METADSRRLLTITRQSSFDYPGHNNAQWGRQNTQYPPPSVIYIDFRAKVPQRSSPRHRKLPPTLGLTELRDNLRISGYPAEKVLEELCAAMASDGKLTR